MMEAAKREDQLHQLGRLVAYYRKLRGMNQETLAEQIGRSRKLISNLESPHSNKTASIATLLDIADALNIPPSYLFDFKDIPPQP